MVKSRGLIEVETFQLNPVSDPCLLCLSLTSPALQREKIREKFVEALQEEFAGKGLRFTRGERAGTDTSSRPFSRNENVCQLYSCHGCLHIAASPTPSESNCQSVSKTCCHYHFNREEHPELLYCLQHTIFQSEPCYQIGRASCRERV